MDFSGLKKLGNAKLLLGLVLLLITIYLFMSDPLDRLVEIILGIISLILLLYNQENEKTEALDTTVAYANFLKTPDGMSHNLHPLSYYQYHSTDVTPEDNSESYRAMYVFSNNPTWKDILVLRISNNLTAPELIKYHDHHDERRSITQIRRINKSDARHTGFSQAKDTLKKYGYFKDVRGKRKVDKKEEPENTDFEE